MVKRWQANIVKADLPITVCSNVVENEKKKKMYIQGSI